jgi:hypothetical protein
MDQLKIILATVKKQQFWVCCGVMLLTSIGCWWWASGKLTKLYNNRARAIDGDFAGATVAPGAPNQAKIDQINNQDKELGEKVYHAWETLYAEQKKNNPFPTKVLVEEFKQEFESLQLPKDQLAPQLLDIYQNHIKKYLPELQKIVKVRHEVGGEEGTTPRAPVMGPRGGGYGGFGGGGQILGGIRPGGIGGSPLGPAGSGLGTEKEYTGIVDWDPGDYAQLEAHFDWGNRAPTTLEVVMAQEDLWVYEALLRAIKKVNEGATTQASAAVKRIVALDIGRDAAPGWQEARQAVFSPPQTGPSAGGMRGAPPMMGRPGQGTSGNQAEEALFRDRYVDEKGEPLPYTPQYPHADFNPPEFKMMPVFMNFVMDQRYLPALLVACANSSMPIEVKRVRILKQVIGPLDTGSATGSGMPGAMGPGMPRMPPMMPEGMMSRGMRGMPRMPLIPRGPAPAGNNTAQDLTGQIDVPVQICAIIYIYNPPNRAKLGIPEEKSPAGATAPGNAASPPANASATSPPKSTPGR